MGYRDIFVEVSLEVRISHDHVPKINEFGREQGFGEMSAGCESVLTCEGEIAPSSTDSLKNAHSIPKCLDLLCGVEESLAIWIEAVLSSYTTVGFWTENSPTSFWNCLCHMFSFEKWTSPRHSTSVDEVITREGFSDDQDTKLPRKRKKYPTREVV